MKQFFVFDNDDRPEHRRRYMANSHRDAANNYVKDKNGDSDESSGIEYIRVIACDAEEYFSIHWKKETKEVMELN